MEKNLAVISIPILPDPYGQNTVQKIFEKIQKIFSFGIFFEFKLQKGSFEIFVPSTEQQNEIIDFFVFGRISLQLIWTEDPDKMFTGKTKSA